jgi:hypothetical protein
MLGVRGWVAGRSDGAVVAGSKVTRKRSTLIAWMGPVLRVQS